MKKLSILLILSAAFFHSCQTKAESLVTNLNTSYLENIKQTKEIQPLISPTPKLTRDINSKVGIVDVDDNQTICFRTNNSNLTEKTPISIVTSLYELPQKVLTATVEKKLEKSCVSDDSDAGDSNPGEIFYYSLVLTDKTIEKSEILIGIGVIQPPKEIQVQNNLAKIDLNGDGKLEFFRLCASNEGLHLTILTGKPLKGKRIWHYYYYLKYDTEADCKKRDWEKTED
jgi:hypothetical protein